MINEKKVAQVLKKASRLYLQPAEEGQTGWVSDSFAAFALTPEIIKTVAGINHELLKGGVLAGSWTDKVVDLRRVVSDTTPSSSDDFRCEVAPLPFYYEDEKGNLAKLLRRELDGSQLFIDKKYWDCLNLNAGCTLLTSISGDSLVAFRYVEGVKDVRAVLTRLNITEFKYRIMEAS